MISLRPELRRLARLVVIGTAVACVGACGVSGTNDDASEAPDAEATTSAEPPAATVAPSPPIEDYGTQQCPSAAAVGAITGTELEQMPWGGSSFTGDISTSSSGCSYAPVDAESMFDDQITISRLATEAPLSKRLFDVLDASTLADADENGFRRLDDLGDGAALDGREVVVRDGDTVIWVEAEPPGGAEPGSNNPAIDLAASALDEGFGIDATGCSELEPFVAEQVGPVAEAIPHTSYVGFDDVEITAEGCAVTLDDGTEVTIAVSDAAGWDAWLANNEDSDFTVSYRSLEVLGRRAFDDGNRLVVDDGTSEPGDSPFEIETSSTTLDDGQQAALRVELAEVALGA
jgi:hypothetical protein